MKAEQFVRGDVVARGPQPADVLEAAPDGIMGVDANGSIALVNLQIERLFGYRRDELIGAPVEMLVPARADHAANRRRFVADPIPRLMAAGTQSMGRHKDGTEFPVDIALAAVETEDGPLVVASVRDVTDRVREQQGQDALRGRAEQQRNEAQLKQRLESLGQLAGGVAHDFNKLLGIIVNYTSFVADEVSAAVAAGAGERWSVVQSDLEQAQRAAERAAELTRQLLVLGQREIVQLRPLDLNLTVRGIERLLRRTIGTSVKLVIGSTPALWPVIADPGQIEQLLVNLATNARDAMPDGGTLSIDTANVAVDAAMVAAQPGLTPGRYVRLRVSDTGTGMSPAVVERAFEPFFTTKPSGCGTGLGLATVYALVTQAGGHPHIYSEPGLGTTFTAFLPAGDRRAVSPLEPLLPAPYKRVETVLIVEDGDTLREVTGRTLARRGHNVLTSASGRAAIELAEHYPGTIDLLLTDVALPGMLGREVAERVRALRPGIRVVYMSGYAESVLAAQGNLDVGATFVEKPFSETELITKLRDTLDAAS